MTTHKTSRITNSGNSSGGGSRGGGGSLLNFLPLLFTLFRGGGGEKKGLVVILLLVGGGYFLLRNSSCNIGTSGIADIVFKFATGGVLDPNQFKKASVYEAFADDNCKNPLREMVSPAKFAPHKQNQSKQGSCVAWSSAYAARSIIESANTAADPNSVAFQIMKSWGPQWGQNGLGYVRYGDFKKFVREACGVDPMPKRGAALNIDFECSIGLVTGDTKTYIPLKYTCTNIFSTVAPVKKGTKVRIEIKNAVECYSYLFTPNTAGSSFVLFPCKPIHSPYCGITGARVFPPTRQ